MSQPLPSPTSTEHPAPGIDTTPPRRSKVAGGLATLARAICCALPVLIAAGVLAGADAAILKQILHAVAAGLAALGLGMWWLHRRRAAQQPPRHSRIPTTGRQPDHREIAAQQEARGKALSRVRRGYPPSQA